MSGDSILTPVPCPLSPDPCRHGLVPPTGFTSPGDDPNTADFRPQAGSPLINAGLGSFDNVVIPRVDITGKLRSATTPSIGAFEP